ncbi:adenosine kinase [Elioraea rosea]|uniref:adenosine kinase n=1 Tax=Elioraea rosea TaxID=2492390 RepID=UPI001183C888|nr:adenosine kinase [Elioraea rosea]
MSTAAEYGVLGIGNAIVDVLARCDDAFLAANQVTKGAMTLIDEARAEELYAAMGPAVEVSGGSAGNTMAAYASLVGARGPKGVFIGKVRNDQLGAVFAHDIRAAGVAFTTPAATDGPPTARCLILVTPDAQRSMNTFLGACVNLAEPDIDDALVAASAVTYLEGYLFDPPAAQAAFRKAAAVAHAAGREVALSLSDPFCVGRHRAAFRALVRDEVDILFANEAEILSLYEVTSFAEALDAVRAETRIACLTRSEKGSVVVAGGATHAIEAEPAQVVDTTGAGDAYAAGFLAGHVRGRDAAQCGRLGSLAAAEAISHYGARPVRPLAELASERFGALA